LSYIPEDSMTQQQLIANFLKALSGRSRPASFQQAIELLKQLQIEAQKSAAMPTGAKPVVPPTTPAMPGSMPVKPTTTMPPTQPGTMPVQPPKEVPSTTVANPPQVPGTVPAPKPQLLALPTVYDDKKYRTPWGQLATDLNIKRRIDHTVGKFGQRPLKAAVPSASAALRKNTDKLRSVYIAATRFGYGAKPGDIDTVLASGLDGKGYLLKQLNDHAVTHKNYSINALREPNYSARRVALRANLWGSRKNTDLGPVTIYSMEDDDLMYPAGQDKSQTSYHQVFFNLQMRHHNEWTYLNRQGEHKTRERFAKVVLSDTSFVDRLVDFWTNHFNVHKQTTLSWSFDLCHGLVEDAISPNLCKKFEDMLIAVEKNPVMLLYLDNDRSVGQNSRTGGGSARIIENHAREILELHTVTPGASLKNYSEDDVKNLSKSISGWRIARDRFTYNGFDFDPDRHEPGAKTVLGKTVGNAAQKAADVTAADESDGLTILTHLARHAYTARNLSTKLARHFYGDEPLSSPEGTAIVRALESTWLKTGGDLLAVYQTLLNQAPLWDANLKRKLKTPREVIISSLRAVHPTAASNRNVSQFLNRWGNYWLASPHPALATMDKGFYTYLLSEEGYAWEGGTGAGNGVIYDVSHAEKAAGGVLNQAPFSAPDPRGYSDKARDWLSNDGLFRWVAYVTDIMSRTKQNGPSYSDFDPIKMAEDILPKDLFTGVKSIHNRLAPIYTIKEINGRPVDPKIATMSALLVSPEFLYR
jgi:uncharacterized protein (DUF1800 family)